MGIFTTNYLTRGFWGDESWTALISQLPIKEIIRVTGEDFHPPLYYFIVHFWGNLFSFEEVTIRLISVIFHLLTPIIAYYLSKFFLKSNFHRLFFSLLVLLSPILFTYAFEARTYALLTFLTAFSTLAFWKGREEKGYAWRTLYFITGSIMVYDHYYAWFILASHGLFLLLFEYKKLRRLILPAIGILLAQLPWLPTLFSQVGSVNNSYWIGAINARTHLEFFTRIAGGDTTSVSQILVARVLGALLIYGFISRLISGKLSRPYLFLLTWLIVPTLLPTLISIVFFPVFFYRYLIFSSLPILLLAVDAVSNINRKVAFAFLSSIALLYTIQDYGIFSKSPYSVREERVKVLEMVEPDSTIYTVLPSFAEVMYYLADDYDVKVSPEGLIQFSGKSLLDAYVRLGYTEIIEPTGNYWIIKPGPETIHVEGER